MGFEDMLYSRENFKTVLYELPMIVNERKWLVTFPIILVHRKFDID